MRLPDHVHVNIFYVRVCVWMKIKLAHSNYYELRWGLIERIIFSHRTMRRSRML